MNKFVKTLLAASVGSVLAVTSAQAAKYVVVDLGELPAQEFSYGIGQNALNEQVSAGNGSYNFPVLFQYLDENDFIAIETKAEREHELAFGLNDIEDPDALRAGTPTANDLAWAVRYLASINNNNYQKVVDSVSYFDRGNGPEELVVFDQVFEGTDTLSRSTNDIVTGITDNGWIYGVATKPFLPLEFTQSDGDELTFYLNDSNRQAFLTTDYGTTIKTITAPEARYGGESGILDIEGNTAVGFASTGVDQDLIDIIERDTDGGCSDPDILDNQPKEACIQNLRANLYDIHPFIWTLDSNGDVVESTQLDWLVTPNEEDGRVFAGFVQAVNASGVAVGYSHGWINENQTNPSSGERRSFYAVIYKDGEVYDFTEDHGLEFDSRAFDINDAGIAVGHVNEYIEGVQRTSFYYVDTNEENPTMVKPKGFFTGSASSARSINENGLIVGYAEYENRNDNSSQPRRNHGFIYDIAAETFTDVNVLTACDSPYDILEARHINDANQIMATAVLKVPRKDAKGELVVDENGNTLYEDVVRHIRLDPVNGEIDECTAEEEGKVVRQGAAFGSTSLLSLLIGLVLFRRRK
ncbi:DUF3466 family protein [Thalassotalea sp. LPB0316]|uniref:DUF3466 family protein n=1 Tax=Thalassotalea sp. LPB0316 TaxID=2769490 RepID=UPI0018676F7B|nr:DUF3466 family protein [Thalassotalea sp. LPB0316]QOL24930.1 DUF3466 family protein [Thalassotalea sp. LPB0316]